MWAVLTHSLSLTLARSLAHSDTRTLVVTRIHLGTLCALCFLNSCRDDVFDNSCASVVQCRENIP